MLSSEKGRFQQLLKATAAQYNKELTEPMTQLYWESLNEFEYDHIKHAIMRHARDPKNGSYMPNIGNLYKLLGEVKNRLSSSEKSSQELIAEYRDAWSLLEGLKNLVTVMPQPELNRQLERQEVKVEEMQRRLKSMGLLRF